MSDNKIDNAVDKVVDEVKGSKWLMGALKVVGVIGVIVFAIALCSDVC